MCELQIHGSKAVIEAVASALSKLKDFRPAEPGIFFLDLEIYFITFEGFLS